MNRAKSVRLTKPTLIIVMLLAIALICGIFATSGTNGTYASTDGKMTTPTDPDGGSQLAISGYTQSKEQGEIETINSLEPDKSVTDFAGAGSANGAFNGNTWSFTPSSNTTSWIVFYHTFELTDDVYEKIMSGQYIVSLSGDSTGTATAGSGDWYSYLYIGMGYLYNDTDAKALNSFYEVKSIIGTTYKIDSATEYTNADPNAIEQANFANVNNAGASSSEQKYLRIGMYARPWIRGGYNLSITLTSLTLSMEEKAPNTNVTGNTVKMTAPDGINTSTTTFYTGVEAGANVNNMDYVYQQVRMTEISSPTFSISMGEASVDTNSSLTTEDFLTGMTTNPNFGFDSSIEYDGSAVTALGFFYTFRLSENMYNALLGGGVTVSLTAPGAAGNANFYTYSYVGIGYANDDNSAKTIYGFDEMKATLSAGCTHSTGYDTSIHTQTNVNFNTMTGTGVNKQASNMESNGNNKYLRIGLWGKGNGSNTKYIGSGTPTFTLSFSPASEESNAPTFNVSNNAITTNNNFTISDASGVDYYVLDGKNVNVAKISNTSFSTTTNVTLASMGSHTIYAVDLWGNTSSTITFTYFYAYIKGQINTDGEQENYSGGKITFNANYNSGNGYQSSQVTNDGAYNSNFNIWAKPNEGYYFAGFTLGDHYSSINLDLQNTSTLASATSASGNNGKYTQIKTDTLEYLFSWNAYTNLNIPADGNIYITANFKSIPTSGEGTYDYDQSEKAVTVGSVSNAPSLGTMSSEVTYGANGDTTAPTDAGTHTVTTKVYWNGKLVGTKNSTIVINQLVTTASFTASSKTYDGEIDAKSIVTGSLSGILDGDSVSFDYNAAFVDKNVGTNKTINITGIALTGAQAGNYVLTSTTASTTGSITKKDLTVNYTLIKEKPYDGNATAEVTFNSFTGKVASDDLSCTLSASYDDKTAVGSKFITVTSTLSGADVGNYNDVTNYTYDDGEITKIALGITYTLTKSKTYDNSDSAEVTFGSFVGNIADDDLTYSVSANYKGGQKAVGTNLIIVVTVTYGGNDVGNYTTTTSYEESGCEITKRPITFTVIPQTQVYGNAAETLTHEVSGDGYATGEDATTLNFSIQRASGNDVGDYAITITASNTNYDITINNSTYTITARPLSVEFSVSGDKVYDGSSDVTDYISYAISGDFDGEGNYIELSGLSASTADKNVGNANAITITFTIANKQNYDVVKNYSLNVEEDTNYDELTINVIPKTLSVKLSYDAITYGDKAVLKVAYDGFEGEDTADSVIATSPSITDADEIFAVGSHFLYGDDNSSGRITVASINGSNYTLSYSETALNVSKKTLKVTFKGAKVGDTDTYSKSVDYTGKEFELAVEYDGFVNDEDENDLATKATATIGTADYFKTSATYDVTVNAGTADNYSFSTETGAKLTINKVALTVTYVSEEITYGDTPNGALEYDGFVNGENESTLATNPIVTEAINSIKDSLGFVPVREGGYTITPSYGVAVNYDVTCVSGTLTVTKKAITATYQNSSTVTYGDTITVTLADITPSNLVGGDSKSSLAVTAYDLSSYVNAGTHTVISENITVTASNYTVTVSGQLAISKATLDISIEFDKDSYVYGDTVLASVVYSGFKLSDDAEIVFGEDLPTVTAPLNAGTHTVTPNVKESLELANYTYTVTPKSLTIAKASLTITYLGETIEYDGTSHAPSQNQVEVAGFVSGDDIDLGEFNFSFDGATNAMTESVPVAIILTDTQKTLLSNYNYTTVTGNFVITPRQITVSAVGITKSYGVSDPTLTYDVKHTTDEGATAIVSESDRTALAISLNRESGEDVIADGYAISVQYTENSNYTVTTAGAIFTITPRVLEISFSAEATKVYDGLTDVTDLISYSFTNKLEGDELSLVGLSASIENAKASATPKAITIVGGYTLGGAQESNYTLEGATTNYDSLTVTVNKATLTVTVTFNGASITEGDEVTEAQFTVSYSGFASGEDENVIDTPVAVNLSAVSALSADTHKIPYNEAEDNNYDFDYSGVGDIIVKAARELIDVSGLSFDDVSSYVYNGEEQYITVTWTDMPSYVEVSYDYADQYGNAVSEHKNAGTYTVTASFNVTSASHYMEQTAYQAEMTIGTKKVTVTFSSEGLSKVYDGNNKIILTAQPTVVGLVGGESLTYDLSATFKNANVGVGKVITLVSTTPTAGENTVVSNYTISTNANELTADIAPKAITIELEEQTSVYGEPVEVSNDAWSEAVEGSIVDGDDLGITISRTGTSTNVGRYPLSATKKNGNYNVTFTKEDYVITPAGTEIIFDQMKVEFEYTGENIAINAQNFYVYTNRTNPTADIVYPTMAKDKYGNDTHIKAVGEYKLTFKVEVDALGNFEEAEKTVTVNVTRATPTFDFSAIDQTTYRYNGAEQHIIGATCTNTDDGAEIVYSNNVFTEVPDNENGEITITVSVGETDNYYAVTNVQHTVRVLKATYDLTATGYAFENGTYDYDGTMRSVEVVGLPEGIEVSYSCGDVEESSEAIEIKDAGTYIVYANYTYDERNYERPTFINSARLQINQINITVEVVNQEGYYGEEPEFDPSGINVIAGKFIKGDKIDLALQLEPKDSYPIGVYQLVAGNTSSSGNYNVTVAKGSYTILPRPIVLKADDKTSQYGDQEEALTYSLDASSPYSIIDGDTFNAVLTRAEGNTPGNYAIIGTIINHNYAITLLEGTYTLTKRKITIALYNQEGTSASHVNKKGYKVSGGILRGDDLDIKVVANGEIGSTPGEYPLTATYNDNPNYEVKITPANFTLRLAAKIKVNNLIYSKLYDGTPYVFDASVSSGAQPIFVINDIYVENSFTEVGVYEITIIAPVIGDYAEPDAYSFTFEIRPTELVAEQGGVIFKLSKENGFGADETLEVEQSEEMVLSGENYTQKIDSAYTIYIVRGSERISLEEYANGENVNLKIKLSEEMQSIGMSTWFVDGEENVLHAVDELNEEGVVEVDLNGGSTHVLFVTDRNEAMPLLIIGCAMGLAFVILFFFYLFRKKAL